jgi:hypothetical protein
MSAARRKNLVANVQRMQIRDTADLTPLGALGVRPPTCSLLSSLLNRGASAQGLAQWLDQSFASLSTDDLLLVWEYFHAILSRFTDPATYAAPAARGGRGGKAAQSSSSSAPARPAAKEPLRVMKKDDGDDFALFGGSKAK